MATSRRTLDAFVALEERTAVITGLDPDDPKLVGIVDLLWCQAAPGRTVPC